VLQVQWIKGGEMDFRLSLDEESFKEKFLSWLNENLPEKLKTSKLRVAGTGEERIQIYRSFQKRLHQAGYAGIRYPKEYGGQGGDLLRETITLEILGPIYRANGNVQVIGHGMVAPMLLICGTEDQKREFISKILDGTHIWCQGFSEPNAGSDLANVATRAVKENGHYNVNGQKIWTSYAHLADYCILVVRTNPGVAKHKGLSYLLVDMSLPGVEIRPLKQITGDSEFNEVFFDDVRVPVDMLVGEEDKGWHIAVTTLMFERVMGDVVVSAASLNEFESMMEMAKRSNRSGDAIMKDPVFRQKLGQCYIDLMAMKYNGYRSLSRLLHGHVPGPEGSIGKLLWSETRQRMTELAMEVEGPYHQLMEGSDWSVDDGFWQRLFLRSKGHTIEAGTSEIQRNIIGERVLGLPKDASRAAPREKS
jgi:alkylation response protein AidB-like acyl-CoA dehydrogenase